MQRLFSSRRKKKKPRLKDALAPTSAFVAVPSSPPPDLSQSHAGNAEPIAGRNQLHLRPAGQPRVSLSDAVIKQTVSFSSQNGDHCRGHSPSHGSKVGEVSVEVSHSQPDKVRSSSVKQSVEISGKSRPKIKAPLLPYSSKRQASGSPRLKSSSPRHHHSSILYDEATASESGNQKAPLLAYSHGNGHYFEENSVFDPGYAVVGRPQLNSTPILPSPEHDRAKPEHYLTTTEYEEVDRDDYESDQEAAGERAKSESKKKVPVYSKVVKRLTQYKSEKKKSSTELPPTSPTGKQEKHKSKVSKEQRKEAVVRFADKEEQRRREVFQFHEKKDFQSDVTENHVERHKKSVENDSTWYGSDGDQHKERDSHYEARKESSIRTKPASPLISYPSQRTISKIMLPMGYRGDHDELEYHEEYEDSAEEELKPLSLNFSDSEDKEDHQGYRLNATFPLTAKEEGGRTSSTLDPLPPYGVSLTSIDKSKAEVSGKRESTRPSSVPPNLKEVPVIRPSSVKKATSTISNNVYIFSERQPNGKLQYFAASPVHYAHHRDFTPDVKLDSPEPSVMQASSTVSSSLSNSKSSQAVDNFSGVKPLASVTREEHTNPVGANAWKRYSTPVSPAVVQSKAEVSPRMSLPEPTSPMRTVTVTKSTKRVRTEEDSVEQEPSHEVVSSHSLSSISVDRHEQRSRSKSFEPSEYTSAEECSGEMEANKRTIQELVDLLAAERKAVEAEKNISNLVEDELKNVKVLLVDLKAENDTLTKIIRDLEYRKEKVKKLESDLVSANTENLRLKMDAKRLESRLERQKQHYVRKMSKLNSQLKYMSDRHGLMESEMSTMRESHSQLRYKFEKLKASIVNYISVDEHKEALENMQSLVEDLTDKNQEAMLTQQSTIRVQGRKNKSLTSELAETEAVIVKLKEENKILKKSCMAAEETVINLQMEVEQYKENEVTLHQQLAKLVAQAEKTLADKNALQKIAEAQRQAAEKVMTSRSENTTALANMEKKMSTYERETSATLDRASKLLSKSEKDHRREKKQHLNEIRQLRTVLNSKHAQLSQLLLEKKKTESRLDYVLKNRHSVVVNHQRGPKDLLQGSTLSSKSKIVQSW